MAPEFGPLPKLVPWDHVREGTELEAFLQRLLARMCAFYCVGDANHIYIKGEG